MAYIILCGIHNGREASWPWGGFFVVSRPTYDKKSHLGGQTYDKKASAASHNATPKGIPKACQSARSVWACYTKVYGNSARCALRTGCPKSIPK